MADSQIYGEPRRGEKERHAPCPRDLETQADETQTDKVSTKPNKTRSQILPFREGSRTCQIPVHSELQNAVT